MLLAGKVAGIPKCLRIVRRIFELDARSFQPTHRSKKIHSCEWQRVDDWRAGCNSATRTGLQAEQSKAVPHLAPVRRARSPSGSATRTPSCTATSSGSPSGSPSYSPTASPSPSRSRSPSPSRSESRSAALLPLAGPPGWGHGIVERPRRVPRREIPMELQKGSIGRMPFGGIGTPLPPRRWPYTKRTAGASQVSVSAAVAAASTSVGGPPAGVDGFHPLCPQNVSSVAAGKPKPQPWHQQPRKGCSFAGNACQGIGREGKGSWFETPDSGVALGPPSGSKTWSFSHTASLTPPSSTRTASLSFSGNQDRE